MAVVAEQEGVSGWVRNLRDRRVEAILEGEASGVEKVITWSRSGPPAAKVDTVEVVDEQFQGEFQRFDILYSGLNW